MPEASIIPSTGTPRCVLLADRHHGLTEGLRGLLETTFDSVVMVADEASLFDAATRLCPQLAVVDLGLHRGSGLDWVRQLRRLCPGLKVILISVHEEPSVQTEALAAGANGYLPKRRIATDLLPMVDAVLAGASNLVAATHETTPSPGNHTDPSSPP